MIFGFSPKFTKLVKLPDGKYEGLWSAYTVKIPFKDGEIEIRASDSVRGINIPCVVSVSGDEIKIETKGVEND